MFVYHCLPLLLAQAPLTVKMKGAPPGWKLTAHLMRGDELVASGLSFPDAQEDDQVVAYVTNKKESVAVLGSPRDVAADGSLLLEFPDRTNLVGEVRFEDGAALEGLIGAAGRVSPFKDSAAAMRFDTLGTTRFKVENGKFSVSVPTRVAGEVRFGCERIAYAPAAHPQVSAMLPVGVLEARVEDEKGKPIKVFSAVSAGVQLGGKAGGFKHAVLAGCDLQLEVSAKGFVPQTIPFKIEKGEKVKLPTVILKRR